MYTISQRNINNFLFFRFVANFRLSREVFRIILEEIEPRLRVPHRNTHIPAINKLATFLSFTATGGYQFSVGNEEASCMSKSKVSVIICECLDIFEEYFCKKWIRLDKTPSEESEVKESFYRGGGIPGVVGCVDGTHVRIKSPGEELKHLYYNRKGFYSINVMAVSTLQKTFKISLSASYMNFFRYVIII